MGVLGQERMPKKMYFVSNALQTCARAGAPACSCSSLVSTRLTLGKYSCDQTLPPTGTRKKPLCLKRLLAPCQHEHSSSLER